MRFPHMTLRLVRGVSILSCLCLGVQTGAAQQHVAEQDGQVSSSNVKSTTAIAMATPAELPESPGAVRAQQTAPQQAQPPSPATAEPQAPTSQSPQSESAQTSSQTVQPSQAAPQKPVGTAAAETSKASGVAASQPAGVAIAPAKQRRVRLIVIRVGAILGAGAAVGTVVALTQGTSSKPPGAH